MKPQHKKTKFTKGDIAWAVVAAASILMFSYTMLIWFDINDLPWQFEFTDAAIMATRFISIFVFMLCVVFYPSRHR